MLKKMKKTVTLSEIKKQKDKHTEIFLISSGSKCNAPSFLNRPTVGINPFPSLSLFSQVPRRLPRGSQYKSYRKNRNNGKKRESKKK